MTETHKKTYCQMKHLSEKMYYEPDRPSALGGCEQILSCHASFWSKTVSSTPLAPTTTGYALHRPARKHFRRNKEIVNYNDSQWQANLVDMLTCIDILCKHAWVIPWKSKTSSSLIEAFKKSSSGEENQRSCKQMPGLNSKTKLFKHSSKMRMCIIS